MPKSKHTNRFIRNICTFIQLFKSANRVAAGHCNKSTSWASANVHMNERKKNKAWAKSRSQTLNSVLQTSSASEKQPEHDRSAGTLLSEHAWHAAGVHKL